MAPTTSPPVVTGRVSALVGDNVVVPLRTPASGRGRVTASIARVLRHLREQAATEGPPPRLPSPPVSSQTLREVDRLRYFRLPDDAA